MGFLMLPLSGMNKGDGPACMISGTALPCRHFSVGTETGPTFKAACRNWPLYMGHVSIESSAHYLHWVPTLQRLASHRFEQRFGHLVKGGAQ